MKKLRKLTYDNKNNTQSKHSQAPPQITTIARDIQNQLITYLVIGSPYTFPTPTLGKRFTNCFRAWKLSKMKNIATVIVTTEKDARNYC